MELRYKRREDRLFADSPGLEIRWGDHGRYLVATRSFRKGEVLWKERPSVAIQSLENVGKIESCGRCFRTIGTLEHYVMRAVGSETEISSLVWDDRPYELAVNSCECVWSCGIRYCSRRCADADMKDGHSLLCTGPLESSDHPLVRFKRYAVKHNEIFLLAAKVYARVLCEGAGEAVEDRVDDLVWPFSLLMRAPWDQCVVYTSELTPEELAEEGVRDYCSELTSEELRESARKAHSLLNEALMSRDVVDRVPRLRETVEKALSLMDYKFFEELIGMFEINCSSLEFYGPVNSVMRDKAIPHAKKLKLQTEIWSMLSQHATCDSHSEGEEIEEDEEMAPPDHVSSATVTHLANALPSFDGIAVFDKISVMQHSCVPNVVNNFAEDYTAEVTALKDIQPGEDVVHSYIEKLSSYEKRKQMLRLWGFKGGCSCPACKNHLDLEEEEEEEEDDDEAI